MKERGIIFNSEMVRAILDDRKTQTRRVVNNVIPGNCLWLKKPTKTRSGTTTHVLDAPKYNLCPLGKIGDRLWVRETFCIVHDEQFGEENWIDYRATPKYSDKKPAGWDAEPNDPEALNWTPSIHMPRWASRITLEITDVRVERIQNMSERDAIFEGVQLLRDGQWKCYQSDLFDYTPTALGSFSTLWNSIYGEFSWYENPWVWVIEFKRV